MRLYRLRVWQARDGWRWRLRAPNGRIMAESGEAYVSRSNARRAVKRLGVVLLSAPIEVA